MPRNIEIKARVADAAAQQALAARAEALATAPSQALVQDDTFFGCAHGRLKLRVLGPDEAELIFYRRADDAGPKTSHYERVPVAAPDALRATLAQACGELGRVRKARRVVLAGRTRIHLDEVEGLGRFVELEVMLRDGEPAEAGQAEAQALMACLGIDAASLECGAYLDLLHKAAAAESARRAPAAHAAPGTQTAAATPAAPAAHGPPGTSGAGRAR